MDKYQSYRDRVLASGQTRSESVTSRTKKVQTNRFNSSETLSDVRVNGVATKAIASRVKTEGKYDRIKYLFKPDEDVFLGDVVNFKGDDYLTIEFVDDEIYPELTGKRCNAIFTLVTGGEKQRIGTDGFSRPIYATTNATIKELPCIVDKKGYNIIDNSAISLPDGFINVYIHYNPSDTIPLNYEFKIDEVPYKVTDISRENIYRNRGFLEIRAEKVIG